MKKILAAIVIATMAVLSLTACEPPVEGNKAKSAAKPKYVIAVTGDKEVSTASIKAKIKGTKIRALNPQYGCKWALFYTKGLPNPKGIVIKQGTDVNTTVNLDQTKTFTANNGKRYKLKADTFRTAGCSVWAKK